MKFIDEQISNANDQIQQSSNLASACKVMGYAGYAMGVSTLITTISTVCNERYSLAVISALTCILMTYLGNVNFKNSKRLRHQIQQLQQQIQRLQKTK